MPRNVVTLAPRLLALPTRRNRETRQRVEAWAVEQFRARVEQGPGRIEFDFPKSLPRRQAKTQVSEALDGLDPRWRKVFVLYPTEDALRQAES